MKRSVCQYLNSFVGRTGNIGVRTGHILTELIRRGVDADCICRGAKTKKKEVSYYDMGLLGHAPRILNGMRIYLAPNFNHRFVDIKLFEWHALRVLRSEASVGAALINHVWDNCPRLIEVLKHNEKKVILDVPIAPFTYSKRLVDRGTASKDVLMVDERFMKLELESFHLADMLLAPSEFVGQELVSAGIPMKKIMVIPFGVAPPTNVVNKDREQMAEKGRRGGLDFCFVGNVSPRKGVIDILNAWSGLGFANDRMHFCGRVYPEVRKKIDTERIRGIILPGYVNPFEYLINCDVFVFPSLLEGCSKAVLEAMSCGLPVIATHSSGTVIRDGIEGFLVEVGDAGAIREKMQWFKENPKAIAVMGEAARVRAREYTWKRYAASVVDIYERL